jgi:hypothetical protein
MRNLLLVTSLTVIGACTHASEEQVVGDYVAQYSFGEERLTLLADGTHEQRATLKDGGPALTARGRWKLERSTEFLVDDSVRLSDCLSLDDGLDRLAEGDEKVRPSCGGFPVNFEGPNVASLGHSESVKYVRVK